MKTKSKERLNHSRSVMGRPVSGFLVIAEIPNRTLDARVREMVERRLALESRATDDRRCNAWTTLELSLFFAIVEREENGITLFCCRECGDEQSWRCKRVYFDTIVVITYGTETFTVSVEVAGMLAGNGWWMARANFQISSVLTLTI